MTYIDEIFNNYFGDDANPHLVVTRADQESFHDNFSKFIPKDPNTSILDIGCGSGRFLHYLKNRNYANIEGVDIGLQQVSIVKNMGIKAAQISSISSFLTGKSYDMITMIGTIEHLSKSTAWDDLKSIYVALKSNGIFLFMTPNMATLSASFRRYIDFTHEVGFSERSAAQIMTILGYRNIQITGDYIKLKPHPKRIAFYYANLMLRYFMRFMYIAESGTDAPKIISKNLVVVGYK